MALLLASQTVPAQNIIQSKTYPQNFFRYPLDLPPTTAGTFGELRGRHFHSGLDFKTNQRIGYPVHAAYDGYVSRLRVQFGGFGNAIYLTHPNGYTTVYGHISKFNPEMEKIIRAEQAKQQSFEVDIQLDPLQLLYCKDDVIALSGNAGASAGPHLHFEIRDTKTEETINPQLFGLTIPDKVPPGISSIAIYHLDGKPFSEKTPHQFLGVAGAAGHYHLIKPQTLNLNGEIGFGINTYDINSTSANHNGPYSIELKLDDKTVYTFAVERFAFNQTHALNAYIDYPTDMTSRILMQKCFIPPGSKITLYPQSVNRGVINFNDNAEHTVEYVVKDVAGNTSSLTLKVKAGPVKPIEPFKPTGTLLHYNTKNVFSNDHIRMTIDTPNLYDDVDFQYASLPIRPGAFSFTYHLHNRLTPIHDSFQLWIKPDVVMGKYTDKAVIVNTEGGAFPGTFEDGYVKATVNSFGDYFIKVDTVPPTIHPINIKDGAHLARSIELRMGDNLSGIKTYTGKIDGHWVLMEWDFKTKVVSYTFDNSIAPGKHQFEFTVSDSKNNTATYKAYFYR